MDTKGKKIILGSGSPRRRELLAGLNIDFTVDTGNTFEEDNNLCLPHEEIPVAMAEGKSFGFHRALAEDEILITADTLVLCGDEVMGKPKDAEDARRMLRRLSGREHEVITAVTIRNSLRHTTFKDVSKVHFKALTDGEISYYIDTFKPFDKAGAYGIQEWIGYIGIDRIDGSFFNIMGLPVHRVYAGLLDYL
ncbi:MAG: Maf family nucleotide pyrophosphatase [Candidatus Cryptobacteroides sp.]